MFPYLKNERVKLLASLSNEAKTKWKFNTSHEMIPRLISSLILFYFFACVFCNAVSKHLNLCSCLPAASVCGVLHSNETLHKLLDQLPTCSKTDLFKTPPDLLCR